MKLKELFKLTGEEQTITVAIDDWHITAPATSLECCLNDETLDNTITSINAEDDELIVGTSCLVRRLSEEAKPMTDNVNHPAHYTAGRIECIDALAAATEGLQGIEAVCTASAIKYLWRWKRKNGVEDLRKAIWYTERLIKELGKPVEEHDGCVECRYDNLEENDEPCVRCKGTACTLEAKLARRDYFERCKEDEK